MSNDKRGPAYKLSLKRKDKTGKAIPLFSFWPNDYGGFNGKVEKAYGDRPELVAIKMSDGTVIKIEDVFINVNPPYDKDRDAAKKQEKSDAKDADMFGDDGGVPSGGDDIPFD